MNPASLPVDQSASTTEPTLRDVRTEALADLIRTHCTRPIRRLLVVGCGSGREAAILGQVLGADTVGIDLVENFDPRAASLVQLCRGDATCLEFRDWAR